MKKILDSSDKNEIDCGSCVSKGCTSCSTSNSNSENHDPTLFTRRNFGHTVLAASAGLFLAGCGRSKTAPAAGTEGKVDSVATAAAVSPIVTLPKGPILTVLSEFYKMGPGPSSSHTMGPMRITYDFYQRLTKLSADQLTRATALKVHLFGSLSATGKGHGTDRASLAGLLGKSPAECPPQFLDDLATNPDKSYPLDNWSQNTEPYTERYNF